MNLLIRFFSLVCLSSSISHAFPPGLARVMSVYKDRATDENVLVQGYGIVIQHNQIQENGSIETVYLLQTVSHLSQGSYDTGHRSRRNPVDGRQLPIPKLLIELYAKPDRRIFGYHEWASVEPKFQEIVRSHTTAPLIASSYFESFRDMDLLILHPGVLHQDSIPYAVSITYPYTPDGHSILPSRIEFAELNLPQDWQWSHLTGNLTMPCPKTFLRCRDHQVTMRDLTPQHRITQRLLKNGFVSAEYDQWIPYSTDPGMSGLPVFRKEGDKNQVVGLVSGSSPHSFDTWLSSFQPGQLYGRWKSSVQQFADKRRIFKVYGLGDFIWMMSRLSLIRVGENLNGIRFQEMQAEGDGDLAPSLRQNNGSGFRHDNGDAAPAGAPTFAFGGRFITQRPGARPGPTAFMMVDHHELTLLLPPTATGLGYFFLQNNLDIPQTYYNVPNERRLHFKLYDSRPETRLLKEEFERFARGIYELQSNTSEWQASLAVTAARKDLSPFELKESTGHVRLQPRYNSRKQLVDLAIKLQVEGLGETQLVVDYENLDSPGSIFNLIQTVVFQSDRGERIGKLNLAGIVTHNPEFVNHPDLDMELRDRGTRGDPSVVSYLYGQGDADLKTLFTLTVGPTVYYLVVESLPSSRP